MNAAASGEHRQVIAAVGDIPHPGFFTMDSEHFEVGMQVRACSHKITDDDILVVITLVANSVNI